MTQRVPSQPLLVAAVEIHQYLLREVELTIQRLKVLLTLHLRQKDSQLEHSKE